MRDLFEEIWSNIRRNKLRTALTGFAVAWGIFMLIFLLGAGNGLIHALESNNSPGLFVCVEVLDIDGDSGGYNLHWAFASGLRAGRSAARD